MGGGMEWNGQIHFTDGVITNLKRFMARKGRREVEGGAWVGGKFVWKIPASLIIYLYEEEALQNYRRACELKNVFTNINQLSFVYVPRPAEPPESSR
jgi:hypothetical protein